MTPTDHDVDSVDGDERTGLNRRQMIKAAGIAGAAAWTAPMIIDSLSSPAAAGTVAPGCYRSWLRFDTCAYVATDPFGACSVTATGCVTFSAIPAGTLNNPAPCQGNNSQNPVTITVTAGISCRITGVAAYLRNSSLNAVCRTATSAGNITITGLGTTSVTIDPTGDMWRNGGASNTPTTSSIGVALTCP